MYCAEDGCVFVHVQKTGGNSVCRALGWPLRHPDKHMSALWLRDSYGKPTWDAAFKFAFVRNPWDRLVSWWSKFDRQRFAEQPVNEFGRLVLSTGATFEEFLLGFEAMPDDEFFKSGWLLRSQHAMVADERGTLMVDLVGRVERISADWPAIARRLGRPGLALPHVNRSDHGPYQRYYSPRTREIVSRHFATDIEVFGYTFDS